jgi:hypothetical protein
MTFNPNFQSIGEAFTQHYYNSFDVPDANMRVQALANLYDVSERACFFGAFFLISFLRRRKTRT